MCSPHITTVTYECYVTSYDDEFRWMKNEEPMYGMGVRGCGHTFVWQSDGFWRFLIRINPGIQQYHNVESKKVYLRWYQFHVQNSEPESGVLISISDPERTKNDFILWKSKKLKNEKKNNFEANKLITAFFLLFIIAFKFKSYSKCL